MPETWGEHKHNRRQYYVGRTLVKADRHGPYEFSRDGVKVDCVCDEATGIVCDSHTPAPLPPEVERGDGYWEPSPTGRFGVVRWHPGAAPDKTT
jgi:hypothetical protein